jgi:CheY-like chemotaxis protein
MSDMAREPLTGRPDGNGGIVIVDDDPGDALLALEALEGLGVPHQVVQVFADGEEALAFARGAVKSADTPRVRLILLDLNLAGNGRHGLEILRDFKTDAELMSIPVVVMSSSRHPADIAGSYASHANAYVVKPADLDGWSATIASVHGMFLRCAEPAPDAETFHAADHPLLGAHAATGPLDG